MSRDQSLIQRRLPWALAGLLLGVSCGPGQPAALPAPPAPVAWPADNPYPEASARRQARLAQLRDPSNDEPAALLLRYLRDKTPPTHWGTRLFVPIAAAMEAGDPDTASALAQLAMEGSDSRFALYALSARAAMEEGSRDSLLALIHDHADRILTAVPYFAADIVAVYAKAGRVDELPPMVLAWLGNGDDAAASLRGHLTLALAHEEAGRADEALPFVALALAVDLPADERDSPLTPDEISLARLLLRLGLRAEVKGLLAAAHTRIERGQGFVVANRRVSDRRRRPVQNLMDLYAEAGMESAVRRIKSRIKGCIPGLVGDFCRAWLTFEGEETPSARMATVALARGRARRGDLAGALEATESLDAVDQVLALEVVAPALLGAAHPEAGWAVRALSGHAAAATREAAKGGRYGWGGELYLDAVDESVRALVEQERYREALEVLAAGAEDYAGGMSAGAVLGAAVSAGHGAKALDLALGTDDQEKIQNALGSLVADISRRPLNHDLSTVRIVARLFAGDTQAPDRLWGLSGMALALHRHGRTDEARRLLGVVRQSRDLNPESSTREADERLAQLLAQLGERDDARAILVTLPLPAAEGWGSPYRALRDLLAELIKGGIPVDGSVLARVEELRALDPSCGEWQRVGARAEALRFCGFGAWGEYPVFPATAFVGPGLLARIAANDALEVWDISGDPTLTATLPPVGEIASLAGDPDSGRVAVGNASGLLAIGDSRTGKWLQVENGNLGILGLEYAADGVLVVRHSAGVVALVDHDSLASTAIIGSLASESHGKRESVVGLSRDRRTAFIAYAGKIYLVDRGDGALPYPRILRAHIQDVAFLPGGERLLVLEPDGSVGLWDAATYTPLRVFQTHGATAKISLAPDGSQFTTAASGELQIWGIEATEPYRRILLGDGVDREAFSFSPDGESLFVADKSGVGYFLSASGDPVAGPLWGHERRIHDTRWSADSRFVATSDTRHGVIVWRLWPSPAEESLPVSPSR